MYVPNNCAAQSIGPANELFATLIQTILAAQCAISPPELWPKDYGATVFQNGMPDTFDFIVVGAGSAGSVVAARLSENPDHNVLLLEAGANPPIESEISHLFFLLNTANSTSNWGYFAEKSAVASKSFENGVHWPRGRHLGGSHGSNSMVYQRGSDKDFNQWAAAGNPMWDYESVLPFFKKSEGMKVPYVLKREDALRYHNSDGPLKIDEYHNKDILKDVEIEAAQELGYKCHLDLNANETIGIFRAHGTLDGNRRCSTAKAYLVPAKNRPNLFIIKNAHVTKLKINEKKRVTGVQFVIGNRKKSANVRKEVILSAGAVNTPQILMLSGIGPKEHLKQHKIGVIADLPVGKNLQDHPVVGIPLAIRNPNNSFVYEKSILDVLYKNVMGEYGPTGNGVYDLLGFYNTKDKNEKYPDIEMAHVHVDKNSDEMLRSYMRELLGYNEILTQSIIDANKDSPLFFHLHILLNPKSTGEILLRSTDPFDHPIIHAGYLTDDGDEDLKTFVRSIRLMQKFIKTKAYRRHQIEEVPLGIPECNAIDNNNSNEYYGCIVRHMIATLFHPAGTAKMGRDSDPSAVVDARLRVKGITALRVADASVMPDITSGHINAPVIMIGERAAHFIKEDWSDKNRDEL